MFVYAVCVCMSYTRQENDSSRPSVTDENVGEAGTPLSPADDDLALRAALYGLVIQSYVDQVCLVILYPFTGSSTFKFIMPHS